MKATLLKTQEQTSKFGGKFYYFFFKGENGKSYRSCIYPNYGNFKRWQSLIGKKEVVLENLIAKGNMIDADSFPRIAAIEPPDTELEASVRRDHQLKEEQINLAI